MWLLSSQALLRKQKVKVAQRRMSTVMSFGSRWHEPFELPMEEFLLYLQILLVSMLVIPTPSPSLLKANFGLGDGTLLSCGSSQYGKLGRDGEDSIFLPVEISFKPVYVAAGPVHSMAICQLDESNSTNVGTTKIASWGWNRHYELGRLGEDMLPGLIDGLDGENHVSVSAGLDFFVALTSKGIRVGT